MDTHLVRRNWHLARLGVYLTLALALGFGPACIHTSKPSSAHASKPSSPDACIPMSTNGAVPSKIRTGDVAGDSIDAYTQKASDKSAQAQITVKILRDLHRSNRFEIRLGELVQEKAVNPALQTYGRHLQREHAAVDAAVLRQAERLGIHLRLDSLAFNAEERKEREDERSKMASLSDVHGERFDAEFLAIAVEGHEKAIDKLETARVQLSGEPTEQLIDKLHKTFAQHLAQEQGLSRRIHVEAH